MQVMSPKRDGAEKKAAAADKAPALPPARPLKPRPKLFVGLCIAFALWIALLITLYFTTVYPHRGR